MEHFHLQLRPHESRSRAWQDDAPIEERPPKEQVRFDINEELGDDPMFPLGLTLFLAEGMATE